MSWDTVNKTDKISPLMELTFYEGDRQKISKHMNKDRSLQIEISVMKENKQGHVIDKSPNSKEVVRRKWESPRNFVHVP